MKHVTLVADEQGGVPTHHLIGPEGRIAAFDVYARTLLKVPFNTANAYRFGLARFFDYFIEATTILSERTQGGLTQEQLIECLEAYNEYLVYGAESGNELAKDVAARNPSPMVSQGSAALLHAPLRGYLDLSEEVRKQAAQLADAGILKQRIAPGALIARKRSAPSTAQVRAMSANSLLAAVIAGGPRLLKEAVLRSAPLQREVSDDEAFPFDLIGPLIGEMTSHRDRSLYALTAASGCRSGEAIQVLWSDVDLKRRTVKLIAPARRQNIPSYLYLSSAERKRYLTWKARATQATLLIEPFATLFFEELELYRRHEWKWNEEHDFVFQHVSPKYAGRPFLLSSRSTRAEAFHKALVRTAEVTQDPRLSIAYTPHSLRHTYGFYVLNYFPRKDGTYGLPMAVVKQLMGHVEVRSTEVYARHDRDLAEEDIAFANSTMFGREPAKRITELKKEILLSRLAAVETQLRIEARKPR